MKTRVSFLSLATLCFLACVLLAPAMVAQEANPQVVIETSKGTIVVELFAQEAPKSTTNFLSYVDDGFYDGTLFHRVIPEFMVQGGGFDSGMKKKATKAPIPNEADNGLKNERGTLAMARTNDPHSATAQFFINTVDNTFLDHTAKSPRGWGYAVFGRVLSGMEAVDAISAVKTGRIGRTGDVPVEPVSIVKAHRKSATGPTN
ncbi:MAG: peptidylprolyl isomerase [Thermoanaerobaculia bacterium]|nr:peptidylprolyl isomerase [Thermoanaerobaculia bacterium]